MPELSIDDLGDLAAMPRIHQLRDRSPVVWSDALNGWIVLSRECLERVYRHPEEFTVQSDHNLVGRVLGNMMLTNDGDEHERHRKPFASEFHLRAVKERFVPRIEALAGELLTQIRGDGRADMKPRFASPFAITMGAETLGVDLGDTARVAETYDAFARAMVAYGDPETLARGVAAREAFGAELRTQIGGSATLIGRAAAEFDDPEDAVSNARVLLFGAIETVESMILNTLWALLTHPGELARVRSDASLLPAAIDEALRWMPPVGYVERWAVADTELGGASIRAGQFVAGSVIAANRDPAFFSHPDAFDIDRPNARKSFAFSHGTHHCLGFNLARVEGAIALERLLAELPGLALDRARLTEPHGFASRRLDALHVVWAAA